MLISIIVAIRDRGLERTRRSLLSLAHQEESDFEVIFVDYGSSCENASELSSLVDEFLFASYVYNETQGMFWNRAHALNTGIAFAKGDVIVFTDIDLIYPENFVSFVRKNNNQEEYLIFDCYYLPENFEYSLLSNRFVPQNSAIGYVGLCVVNQSQLADVYGYDEFYMIWGVEDDDLYKRLANNGCKKRRISVEQLPIYHQWHPSASHSRPTIWYNTMVAHYYHANDYPRNHPIGKLVEKSNRPTLDLYREGAYKAHTQIKLLTRPELTFLDFWDVLDKLEEGGVAWFEYIQPPPISGLLANPVKMVNSLLDRQRWFNYRLVYNPLLNQDDVLGIKHIQEFIQFFVGVNRNVLEDYYVKFEPDRISLIIVKRSM